MMDHMTCERFESRLADLLEGELDTVTRAAMEAHASRCDACGPLAADLRRLTSEAAALPLLRPSRDLWEGIEARIATPMVPLVVTRVAGHARSVLDPRLDRRVAWLAAAAAILVVATAGITHLATRRAYEAPAIVASAPALPAPVGERLRTVVEPAVPGPVRAGGGTSALASRDIEPPDVYELAERAARAATHAPATSAGAFGTQRRIIDSTFAAEIGVVEQILRTRRSDLDPATVEILERNLRLIDGAIRESRAALARDPGSAFLNEELTGTLNQKLELLRIAATLPART